MDTLLTILAIGLLCVAAWLLYKRWTNRYTPEPVVDRIPEEEFEAEEEPEPEPTPAPQAPELKKDE